MFNESEFNQNDEVIVFLKETVSATKTYFNNTKAIIINIKETETIKAVVTAVYQSPDPELHEFIYEKKKNHLEKFDNNDCDFTIFTGDINILPKLT